MDTGNRKIFIGLFIATLSFLAIVILSFHINVDEDNNDQTPPPSSNDHSNEHFQKHKDDVDLFTIQNYLVYYGAWNKNIVNSLHAYDLIVLDLNNGPPLMEQKQIIDRIRAGADGILGTEDDVLVLGYISIGEDVRTFDQGEPAVGDGRGPSHFDRNTGKIIYQYGGVASYYVDEWTLGGPHEGKPGHDGLPDRNSEWGACYVNAGDPKWQDYLIGKDRDCQPFGFHTIARVLDCDGFFLDTPETASPWERFGWTAQGMVDLIARVSEEYDDKIILLNRGLFFFIPHYREHYSMGLYRYIDILLYESYYLDSAYHDDPYHINPWFQLNRHFVAPKLNAELSRNEKPILILNMDYAKDPNTFVLEHPEIFQQSLQYATYDQGRVQMIANRQVTALYNPILDHPPTEDLDAPLWSNTTVGYKFIMETTYPFETLGSEDAREYVPRVGLQKAIPGDGEVTLRWDVAIDQTRQVRYNVYYDTKPIVDFDQATRITNVPFLKSVEYTDRSYLSTDDACPYEFTVTSLSNETTYYFAVRAEDATQGVENPRTSRIGPSGGIEETNTVVLAATPRSKTFDISIDGVFEDWSSIPAVVAFDEVGEDAEIVWDHFKITDDELHLYLYARTKHPIKTEHKNGIVFFLSTDQKSYTGYRTRIGANYMILGFNLYRYVGEGDNWAWEIIGAISYALSDRSMELVIEKSDIELLGVKSGVNILLYADNPSGAVHLLPSYASYGYNYQCLAWPLDTEPPTFDGTSVQATDLNIDGQIRVAWQSAYDINEPITYYVIDAKTDQILAQTTHTSIHLAGLDNDRLYTIFVRAQDSQGNATDSKPVEVTSTLDTLAPQWTQTIGLQHILVGDGMVTLYWNQAFDAKHPPAYYNVYVDTDELAFDGTEQRLSRIRHAPSDNLDLGYWMATVTGLTNETTYHFAIRCMDRIGNEDDNTVQISATPNAPERVSVDTIDGMFGDWAVDPNTVFLGEDEEGDGILGDPSSDILRVWATQDQEYIYLRWELAGPVNLTAYDYIVFIDIDHSAKTGFLTNEGTLGAEYIAINGNLYEHMGRPGTDDWTWKPTNDPVHFTPGLIQPQFIEMALSKNTLQITNKESILLWFYITDNIADHLDECYPDYKKGGVEFVLN